MTQSPELKGRSFFQKLLIALLSTGLVAVLTTSWAYVRLARRSIRQEIQNNLAETLKSAVDYFHISYAFPLTSDLEFVGTSPVMDAFLVSQENEIFQTRPAAEFLFLREIRTTPLFYRSMRFLDSEGNERVVVEGNKRVRSYQSIKDAPPDVLHQKIFALFGRLRRIQIGSALFEGPFQAGPGGTWIFLMGRTRPDPESAMLGGAVIIEADLTEYLNYLTRLQFRGYRVARVEDPQGRAILAPADEGGSFHSHNVFTFTDTLHLGTDRAALLRLTFQNGPRVLTDALAPIFQMTFFIVGIIMSAVILLAFAVSRQFSGPLISLAQAAGRLAKGERSFQVPVSGGGEIRLVTESFNRMISDLDKTTVSKRYMDHILESMLDGLIVLDAASKVNLINKAGCILLGYAEAELIGRPVTLLFPSWEGEVQAPDPEEVDGGLVRNVEKELAAKDGRRIPVLFSSAVMRDESGRRQGLVCLVRDITERKRVEAMMLQSEKMSSVGLLASGVAHEINNPLGVILGFAQALERRLPVGDVLEMPLKAIEREAIRCKVLVQELLTFSRTSKLENEPVDLNLAVTGALDLVLAKAKVARVQVLKEFAPDLPLLLGNSNQIQQVVVNLANNAVDAMADREGVLIVRTEELVDGAHSWICLKIIDSGPGIPAEILPKIFNPFFTTKPVGKGTGLGLSLTHEIVQKHSGIIEVESRPGHTEFRIKFPAHLWAAHAA